MNGGNRSINIAFAALFTAIISIISQISVITPLGVPITLQTFAVSLCGYLLGANWGIASVVTYILAGTVGLPVFSGFQGGIQHITSATGGFIMGFMFIAFFCGISPYKFSKFFKILMGIIGLVICHIIGIVQFKFITGTGIIEALITVSLPFILKDIISVIVAFMISIKIKKNYK